MPERFLQPGAEYAAAFAEDGSTAQGPAAAAAAGDQGVGGGSGGGSGLDRRAIGGSGSGQPLRFFPFSQGARDCIGQVCAAAGCLLILRWWERGLIPSPPVPLPTHDANTRCHRGCWPLPTAGKALI